MVANSLTPRATLTILLLTAFLGGMAAYIISVVRHADPAPSRQVALCSDEPGINNQINEIAFKALDDALRQQIQNLFTVWMKDDAGQPARAAVGVKQSALAYIHARQAIINWNVPSCTPGEEPK